MEGEVKNNLMVGDWTVYQGDNQKYCVVEFNDFNGRTDYHHYEAFGLYLENGKIKELYYEGGEKHFELTETGYKSFFVDGSIYIEKFVDENGNQVVVSNSKMGPHNMINDWGRLSYPKELSYKSKYSSKFTLLSKPTSKDAKNLEWVLTNCFENEIMCENFSELRPYPEWEGYEWYCELISIILSSFLLANEFHVEFKNEIERAFGIQKKLQTQFKKRAEVLNVTMKFAAHIFPELIRHSLIRNKIEDFLLLNFYTTYGSGFSNKSVGLFQMKPRFIEKLENHCQKY